ncbi:MAG: hypothetical protein AB1656_21560 [Candidatus Omnitrophota bacterium]
MGDKNSDKNIDDWYTQLADEKKKITDRRLEDEIHADERTAEESSGSAEELYRQRKADLVSIQRVYAADSKAELEQQLIAEGVAAEDIDKILEPYADLPDNLTLENLPKHRPMDRVRGCLAPSWLNYSEPREKTILEDISNIQMDGSLSGNHGDGTLSWMDRLPSLKKNILESFPRNFPKTSFFSPSDSI